MTAIRKISIISGLESIPAVNDGEIFELSSNILQPVVLRVKRAPQICPNKCSSCYFHGIQNCHNITNCNTWNGGLIFIKVKEDTMKKELDLCEKLRLCRPGIKLWNDTFGEVTFDRVNGKLIIVKINEKAFFFDKRGVWIGSINGVPSLFPSKDNHDWDKFEARKDLSIGTIVAVHVKYNSPEIWYVGVYGGNGIAYAHLNKKKEFVRGDIEHIVPMDKLFCAEDPSTSGYLFDDNDDYCIK